MELIARIGHRVLERRTIGAKGKRRAVLRALQRAFWMGDEPGRIRVEAFARGKATLYGWISPDRGRGRSALVTERLGQEWDEVSSRRIRPLTDGVRLNLALVAVLRGDAQPSCPVDPGPGYWDGRPDYRTGKRTVYGKVIERDGYGARLRHVATSTCPSGPCGMGAFVVTYQLTDIYVGLPAAGLGRESEVVGPFATHGEALKAVPVNSGIFWVRRGVRPVAWHGVFGVAVSRGTGALGYTWAAPVHRPGGMSLYGKRPYDEAA